MIMYRFVKHLFVNKYLSKINICRHTIDFILIQILWRTTILENGESSHGICAQI